MVESSQGEKDEINGRRESGHSLVEIIRREDIENWDRGTGEGIMVFVVVGDRTGAGR